MLAKIYNDFLKNKGEQKWQKFWKEDNFFKTKDKKDGKPKYYILDMFPYPSGTGLHVGHPKGYIATDVTSRFKRMNGFNILHPMGWDAFGLPAENYAIKNKIHPSHAVKKNIKKFKEQISIMGLDYDWSREIDTTDPDYYKWTQWIFVQMFKKGLAYESDKAINWCPSCKTGLANEDLEGGLCERCGSEVEQKPMRQWVLKITDYADRLLDGLESLDWEEHIKEMQINWIGKSHGADVDFKIKDSSEVLKVFTTRPNTLFGATFMVIAPEHSLIEKSSDSITNLEEIKEYIKQARNKSDLERGDLNKDKSGVELKGIKAINPVNNKEIPVFVADYVMMSYGTGAIMAVPAHDERDWEFAKKYDLDIIEVIKGGDVDKEAFTQIDSGEMVNSDFLNGINPKDAIQKMSDWLLEKDLGKKTVQYKLRDWIFSRQRYWGEPIPMVHCEKCGVVPVPEEDLPVLLPEVESYEPTGTGESPLANIDEWVNTECPKCGGNGKREINTMPNWAGSSWYYLRYMDPQNKESLVDKDKEKYWASVDLYVGGAEHATRHLIYARFWHKFLYDIGVVSEEEPFKKLKHVGLVLAEDGRKMSKRWNNVVNPDDVIEEYGADTLRLYEMFMGPFDQSTPWDKKGMVGVRRFLDKVWNLSIRVDLQMNTNEVVDKTLNRLTHQTIKKVTEDIGDFRFNTAISQMMILVNQFEKQKNISIINYELLIIILSPFAPHICEELWSELGYNNSIVKEKWPEYDRELIKEDEVEIVIQVNGKVRDKMIIDINMVEDGVKAKALGLETIQKWLKAQEPKKIIYVKGKLINIVI
jgi:leucyl-tRNA synthetase